MTAEAELEQAYRAAVYELAGPRGTIRLSVGEASPVLDRLFAAYRTRSAARLTAANPGSAGELPPGVNDAANARLAADFSRSCISTLPCSSRAPDGSWPEEGFLAFGLSRAQAEALARLYRQKGFLWLETGRPVALVML